MNMKRNKGFSYEATGVDAITSAVCELRRLCPHLMAAVSGLSSGGARPAEDYLESRRSRIRIRPKEVEPREEA